MKLTPEQADAAKKRRLKEPLEITGYNIKALRMKVVSPDAPRTTQEFAIRTINTIGDLAMLEAHMRLGKFIPVPDLSIQALMIVIDKVGLLEEKEEDKHDG